jgi:Cd2+/Zn2+-exporting ATPase
MKVSTFHIEEMCCPTEEHLIRKRLEPLDEVDTLEFNLMARTVRVRHSLADEAKLVREIAATGMKAVPERTAAERAAAVAEEPPKPWYQRLEIVTLIVSGLGALVAEILALGGMEETTLVRAIALVAVVAGGYRMVDRAWRSLRTFTLNIHFLMTIAVIGALVVGEWPEAAMVVFLFAVAELIEARSLARARNAIRALMELAPSSATTLRGLGWQEVPVDEVEEGEIVRIKPGERLAFDGRVKHGDSSVDQAAITGESMPIDKHEGDDVFAGSINVAGTFDYEVTRIAAESTVSQIAQLVEKAGANKATTERFIDRFARWYTPVMLLIAILVAFVPPLALGEPLGEWVYRGLVMLVIGCPCALVISTPVTIVSGLAAAARRGILIKGGAVIEAGRDLVGIAFDKTGTLTEGRPAVTDVVALDGMTSEQLLHLAAAVEGKSEHPIASAIVAAHRHMHGAHDDAVVTEFRALTGRGASARVDGDLVVVGNHRLAHDLDVCSPEVEQRLAALEAEGKTTILVMSDSRALGVIAVADAVRSSSAAAIAELHELGLKTYLLTGDNDKTARSIAGLAGIDDVRADLLPIDKINAIEELQKTVGPIGMAGDGINDVPALAQSSVGFAMGVAGSHIALETADVALMEDNLLKLPEFIRLARSVRAVLWQNIGIALGLKFVFFGLAVAGHATLWMAVFADMGASLIVVFNGLRLLRLGRARSHDGIAR